MNYWVATLACFTVFLAPLLAQDVETDEDSDKETGESAVTIRALLSEGGNEVPSLITIFRGDGEKPVRSGMRTHFELPPGEYRVRAKSRDALATASLKVPPDSETTLDIVLDAGYLRLRSLAAEDGEEVETYYEVFKAEGLLPDARKRFTGSRTGDFLLPAGKYVVNSKWGAAEAEKTLEVVANEVISADLILNAGSLLLSTALAEDGEEVRAYYEVYEAEAALDGSRKRIAGGSSGRFQVPAGKYLLKVTWGRAKTDMELEVVAGEMTATRILMPAGVLNVTSRNAAGEEVSPFLTIYKAEKSIDGSRERVSAGTTPDHQLAVGEYVIEGGIDEKEVTTRGVVRPSERTEVVLTPEPS